MRIVGIIPARYASTRFPGKPLVPICGKEMIRHVYEQAKQIEWFDDVFVATDDDRIAGCCKKHDIPVVMTNQDCPNHIHRIYEVSRSVEADFYVSINGDEPLISPDNIDKVKPKRVVGDVPYFGSVYRDMDDPAEVVDPSNVKIVLDKKGNCLYQSRTPIPNPKGSVDFRYKKAIGIECFNKPALELFANTGMGTLERIEDIDHLRFLENGASIYYRKISSDSLSVDTPADLEKVEKILRAKQAQVGS